jgi:hypothetical protein
MARGWLALRPVRFGSGIVFLAVASAPVIGVAGELADVGPKVRYWSWIVGSLLLWLGAGAVRPERGIARWISRLALAVIVLVNLIALANLYENPRYANEDVRSVARYLEQSPASHEPVFVISDYMAPPVRYYLNGSNTLCNWLPYIEQDCNQNSPAEPWVIYPRSEADVRGSLPFDDAAMNKWIDDLRSVAGPLGQFWFIYTRAFHGDQDAKLLHGLQERKWIELERQCPGVRLYRGQLTNSK